MRSRRLAFALVLLLVLVGALIAGNATANPAPVPPAAAGDRAGAVWFCPGPPPDLQRGSGRVAFANTGTTPADIVVTNLLDKGDPVRTPLTLAANSVTTQPRDRFGASGALTIESFGGDVVVEDGIEATGGIEFAPCATSATPESFFAAGTTVRGVQQWLTIENPYAADAKVDVILRTGNGVRRLEALQNLDISRRSRMVIPVDKLVVREANVAVEVAARIGSVVSAETLVFTSESGAPGIAMTLGSPRASDHWTLAAGVESAAVNNRLAIAAVGNDDAQVDVQVRTNTSQTFAPVPLTVTAGNASFIQLGRCATGAAAGTCVAVPQGTQYSLQIKSDDGVPIVAQVLGRSANSSAIGAVTALGEIDPARSWTFARSRVRGERLTTITLFNPSAKTVRADIALVHSGHVDKPANMQAVSVPAGRAVTVRVISSFTKGLADAAVTVHANDPLYVERSIDASTGTIRSVGFAVG